MMTQGEVDNAKRRALNLFDKWNDAACVAPKSSGYYYEMQSVIEDAVEIGIQGALKQYKILEAEN